MSQEERDAERRKMQEERQRRAVSVSLHMQSCGERIGQRKKSLLWCASHSTQSLHCVYPPLQNWSEVLWWWCVLLAMPLNHTTLWLYVLPWQPQATLKLEVLLCLHVKPSCRGREQQAIAVLGKHNTLFWLPGYRIKASPSPALAPLHMEHPPIADPCVTTHPPPWYCPWKKGLASQDWSGDWRISH